MKRISMLATPVLALAILLLAFAIPADAKPVFRIAYLHDGPAASWAEALRDSLYSEVRRVLAADFDVRTPSDLIVIGETTRESCREGLTRLLARTDVDLIIATGPLSSLEAGRLTSYPKPVIGMIILDPEMQGVPYANGASGVKNFTYVTPPDLFNVDLAALDALVDYRHLAVLAPGCYLGALPDEGQVLADLTGGQVVGVVADGQVSEVLAAIPPETDAVYMLPLITTGADEIVEILDGLKERRLPVLSARGEPDVRSGALVGVAPDDWHQRVMRRVALAAGRIAGDEDAAGLPVNLARTGSMIINARTARAVDVSPPFSLLIDAVIIDEYKGLVAESLDLLAAMNEAQRGNHDIAAAMRLVSAGEQEVKVTGSVLLPQLAGGLSGSIIDDDRATALPTASEQTFAGHLDLTQIIWSDDARAEYSIAKDQQTAREQELVRVRLNVGLEAAAAFLDVLRANTRVEVQRQNLAFSRTNLERAQVRVDVGDANRSELHRWESKIAGEQAEVVAAVTLHRTTLIELNRVLGRPLEQPAELVDATLDDQLSLLTDPRIDRFMDDPAGLLILRDFLTSKGLGLAPELLQFDASIKAQQRAHTAAKRSFWSPTVGLSGGLDHAFGRGGAGADMSATGMDDTDWRASLFLTLPLFEGGARFAETKLTSEEIYRLQRDRDAAAQRIEQGVRSTVYQATASYLTITLSRRASAAAARNLELVADNYTLGRTLLVDLIDAQTNALITELAAADAVYRHLQDLMQVERAVGRFTFFTEDAARQAWVDELEAFAARR